MLIIQPNQPFIVDYYINNPSDSSTYYVRARIYSAVSGALLKTLDLTQNLNGLGNYYFGKSWTTPADTPGAGLQITIKRTVYVDSGYTQESPIYGTTVENYLVRQLASQNLGGFAGNGGGVSGTEIRKILREIIKEELDTWQGKPYDDSGLKSILEELKSLLGGTDHSALQEASTAHLEALLSKHTQSILDRIGKTGSAQDINTLREMLETMEQRGFSRHAEGQDRVIDLISKIESMADDKTVHGKIDDLHESVRSNHDAVLDGLAQPLQIKKTEEFHAVRKPKKVDSVQLAKENENSEQLMTVEKLLQESRSTHDEG